MKLRNCFRQLRLAVCLSVLAFNAFTATAQTPTFNVTDFGAVGDGVTDDGPAFQRALDAVANAGGGTLFVPAGLYFVATPVVKDFSNLNGGTVTIQGVPSIQFPALPNASSEQLSMGLNLTSEIIPATGFVDSAFTLTDLRQFTIEHLAFTGRETEQTDAFITLNLSDIKHATVRHCEFYGISTFGLVPGQGGGNIIRASRSDLSIEQSVFLGSTANSGAYAPIVENTEWFGFEISNSIFVDYGQRSFYGKMGLGAPLSWINFNSVAPRTAESSRREIIIRDTFLDEGGWIGITAFPHRWGTPVDPIDLLYISGLKMNVSNLGTAGNQLFNVSHVLIEDSLYGWSRNTSAAIDLYGTDHAILDRLTCIEDANRIRTDDRTDRLTVINSEFGGLDSLAQTTTVLETAPDEDPVQYVRQQFLSVLGRQPDPAAHFYWSDRLVRCGNDQDCIDAQHAELGAYLANNPQADFSLAGTVTDEAGDPISGAMLNLTGAQFATTVADEQGKFQFANLPTSGVYTVTVNKRHYTFETDSLTLEHPARDVNVVFHARLNRHTISGRVTKADGSGAAGVTMQLNEPSMETLTTDTNGNYSFADLPAGENYVVMPLSDDFVFGPGSITLEDLSADRTLTFVGKLRPELMNIQNSGSALVIDSVSFALEPFSIFDYLGFGDDGVNRVMIFAKNLETVNDVSQVSVVAEDAEGDTYPLEVEFMANLPGLSWLKQINVKLSPELSGKCVQLKISAADIDSNKEAQVCVAGK